MNQMLSITKKELKAYFGSPMAALFIGAFLVAALFSFFWLETFFARNTADIRPLFRWMPILMIFLVGTLTMRQWSEEQRAGTMEILMTLPVKLWQLVLGKFLAVLALVAIALALTLGLPITVSLLGNLDWGPVFGGYLGALLMASSYIAIGLFISSRTDNQIVALIMTVLVTSFFYIIGSTGITNFMDNNTAEIFRSLGTGSRFISIERGVIDLRDIFYYASLSTFFLILNGISLDSKRWSKGVNTHSYRQAFIAGTVLIALNLLAANLWLNKVNNARLDLTENHIYSLSQTTRDLVSNLPDPLILRGYFSEKTHPLLSPLVPRIKDMLREYGIASNGHVQVSFVDPKYNEKMEAEANQEYGIKPVPFQVAGRYESSVVNSYFNILIKYGDQHIVLGFNDLIEVRQRGDGQIDVHLRNLEYDLTKSIKKVVYGFQSLGDVFAKVKQPLTLTAIISRKSLPKELAEMPKNIDKVANELVKESDGKLRYTSLDPDAEPAKLPQWQKRFGVQPIKANFFSNNTFYLYLYLTTGGKNQRIYLTANMGEAKIKKEVAAVLKRSSAGFLKTIGLWVPSAKVSRQMAMMGQQPRSQYQIIQQTLPENYNLEKVDLSKGLVPGDIDVLLLIAPQNMTNMERFAIDQYLMKGGAVVALAGNYLLDLNPYSKNLRVKEAKNGIDGLLNHYGIKIGKSLVMDEQNEPFPIPITRNLGGFQVQEIKRLDYPFFVDVRAGGMDKKSPIVANLPAVTMNWASPLTLDKKKNKERKIIRLLTSSPNTWLQNSTNIQPDMRRYPGSGFAPGQNMKSELLAVSERGVFKSYFAHRPDPRQVEREKEAKSKKGDKGKVTLPTGPVIKKSPESARLVVVGSSEFINDTVIQISRSISQDRFLNNIGFLQNSVDWAVEDEDLLSIRSRGTQTRLLMPLTHRQQIFWEWLNYIIALLALVLISLYGGLRRRKEKPMILEPQQA
ncbi:MAG: ABC transporter permease subunit [Deltaproteobacteria bacterium]|nr:ABC transporter permease subunit [Deltaproteobacteria bacterium]